MKNWLPARRFAGRCKMGYYNYHGTARRLLGEGKLLGWYYTKRHNHISPALVLVFDDVKHPKMPLREYRWAEYLPVLPPEKQLHPDGGATGAPHANP